jgi:vacuolar-type H+-ATPase subunit E/Vma4
LGLVAAAAGVAALAQFVVDFRRARPTSRGRAGDRRRAPWFPFRSAKGEWNMRNRANKLWGRGERKPDVDVGAGHAAARTAAYLQGAGHAPATPAEPEPTDLADVGAEVGTVLKSAQEAATTIRRQAREEAAKILEEAKAAAAADVEEAHRRAEADRADGRRVRAEAEAYAEQVRSDAESEAERVLEDARRQLEETDDEIERRLRRAEKDARERRALLEAEAGRYHKQLETMLDAVHGVSSELEELLRPTNREKEAEESLEDVLQRDAATSRRG